MKNDQTLEVIHPAFAGKIGVGRREITPPVGIYARMWGCARHDVAEGIHRPLYCTVLSFQGLRGGAPLVLAGLDLGWWREAEDEWFLRGPLLEALGLDASRLMIHLTHTHSGPSTSRAAQDKPGGEKIEPYLCQVRQALIEAAGESLATAQPATLSWAAGRCDLAANRDLPDPDGAGILCGFHPQGPADDTLLVGRVCGGGGQIVATMVNYACHPTTLGGANRLISPDYIGAMRETLEAATGGARCLFLQGASGELGPRQGYEQDPAIADRNGRQLGYAALSALEGLLPNAKKLSFAGREPSGAPLGRWKRVDHQPSTAIGAVQLEVQLPLKKMPSAEELQQQLRQCTDRLAAERLERALDRRKSIGDGDRLAMPLWIWRLGDSYVVATPAEAYSALQVKLRRRFPHRAIAVLGLVNGCFSYLPTTEAFSTGAYQADVSLFQPGCLETVLETCVEAVTELDRGG